MENVSDALIMGFSVLIFVIALTICITMFSMARTTSDFVLHKSDKTNYYTYDRFENIEQVTKSENRVVGVEDIVPTLYRYYKEDYRVEFYDRNGNSLPIYRTKMGENEEINYFDVKEEIKRNEPWTESQASFKKNLDAVVSGGKFSFTSGNGYYNYEVGLLDKFNGKKFKEQLVYSTDDSQNTEDDESNESDEKKMIIKYTEI